MRNVWVHPEPPANEINVNKIRGLCLACGWQESMLFLTKLEERVELADWRFRELQRAYCELRDRHEPRVVKPLYEGECGKPGERSDG